MKSARLTLLVVTLITISLSAWAKPRTKAEMDFWANKTINTTEATAAKGNSSQTDGQLSLVMEKETFSVYASTTSAAWKDGNEHGRFAIISNDDLLPAVLGYSDTTFDAELKNQNFRWWLEAMNNACQYYVENNIAATLIKPSGDVQPFVEPMVTTRWGQEAPYYNMCPMGTDSGSAWDDYNTNGRCVTGCVATAMAQILNYHQTPQHGQGIHSVKVKQANGSYETYTVDYDEAYYDWDNMLDIYTPGKYTQAQGDAVAQLMYHCGVAADMEYATDGSGTYDNLACDGLQRNFGINDATYYERQSYTDAEWMNMIFTELSEGRPVLYGGNDMTYYAGHCFLFDGYDENGKVHVNWGWEGKDDGYFDVAILSVAGYSFSSYQDMVTGIQGNGSAARYYAVELELQDAGCLSDSIAALSIPLDSIAYITLAGKIDGKDIATIRNIGMMGALRKLDLRETAVADSLLPDSAFAQCPKLRYVTLPECIRKIGNYAFAGCTGLMEMRLYNREKPEATSNIFKDLDLSNATLLVRAGTKTRFSRALPWKNFGKIGEFGIAVSARNCSRDYGEENPKFYWTVQGGSIDGEPEITCDATKDSPAGKYTLHISRGTVMNPETDFVDGYMIVNEKEPVGIDNVSQDIAGNATYDLSGRRQDRFPRGTVVITNKKKYIVK